MNSPIRCPLRKKGLVKGFRRTTPPPVDSQADGADEETLDVIFRNFRWRGGGGVLSSEIYGIAIATTPGGQVLQCAVHTVVSAAGTRSVCLSL